MTLGQLPVGPSVGAAAAVLILGSDGVAAAAAAGVLMTVTGTVGGLLLRRLGGRRPAVVGAPMRIVQMSDLHVGAGLFRPDLLRAAIEETNELAPDLVVVAGDLTMEGYRGEFE